MSVALACMNRGWTEADYEQLLEESVLFASYPHNDKKRDYDTGRAWMHAEEEHDGREVYTTENYVGSHGGRDEVREALLDLAASPLVQDLARNPRTTVLAVIQEGVKRGAWTLDLSNREIAEMTGFTHRTVGNHLATAEKAGALKIEDAGPGMAHTIVLETDPTKTFYQTPRPLEGEERVFDNYPHNISMGADTIVWVKTGHSVFSRHGLGPTAGELYAALVSLEDPSTVRTIAAKAGCSPSTAAKHLPRMLDAGLVVKRLDFTPPRYEAAVDPDLEAIANLLQVDESREKMEKLHDTERELFARARTNWQPPEPETPVDPQPELLLLPIPDPPPADDEVLPEDDYVEPVPVWDPPSVPDLSTGQDPFEDLYLEPGFNPFDAFVLDSSEQRPKDAPSSEAGTPEGSGSTEKVEDPWAPQSPIPDYLSVPYDTADAIPSNF